MTAVEITLIIIGVIFMLGSFFIQEKLTRRDIEHISDLSEKELKMIVEKRLKSADSQIESRIEDILDESMDIAGRALDKESYAKMKEIEEYSNTILESMNKTHNEIVFLYSMLNDKHSELTGLAGELQQFSEQMKSTADEMLGDIAEAADEVELRVHAAAEPVEEGAVLEAPVEQEEEETNHNQKILNLHREGVSDMEIAKMLGLGLGEIKLVLGLYKGE